MLSVCLYFLYASCWVESMTGNMLCRKPERFGLLPLFLDLEYSSFCCRTCFLHIMQRLSGTLYQIVLLIKACQYHSPQGSAWVRLFCCHFHLCLTQDGEIQRKWLKSPYYNLQPTSKINIIRVNRWTTHCRRNSGVCPDLMVPCLAHIKGIKKKKKTNKVIAIQSCQLTVKLN